MYGAVNINKDTKPLTWLEREPDYKRLTVAMDPEQYELMKEFCDENYMKVSQFVRFAVPKEMAQWSKERR